MPKERRVVLADDFSPQETLALSKCGPPSDVDKARKNLKPGVYDVRKLVQVDGDIEIVLPEKTPEKFDAGISRRWTKP